MTLPPELRDFVEVPNRTLLPAPGIDLHDDGRYLLVRGPAFAGVAALRAGPAELHDVVDDVRARVPPEIRTTWWLGPSTEPSDARERLLELGLHVADVPSLEGMLAVAPPEPGPPEIEVTRVETIEQFRVFSDLRWEAFEVPTERRELERAHEDELFAANRANCHMFVARIDGRPAAGAMSILGEHGSFLVGGCTVPWARGRGAYRALVRARWDDAVARGRPALVVHANPATSAPILKRLGFRTVCALDRLEDGP
jgi:hypothetical protein